MNNKIADIKNIGLMLYSGTGIREVSRKLKIDRKRVREIANIIKVKGITPEQLNTNSNFVLYRMLYPERELTDVPIEDIIEAIKNPIYTDLKSVWNDLFFDKITYQGFWKKYKDYCASNSWYDITQGELPGYKGTFGWSSPFTLCDGNKVFLLIGKLEYSGVYGFSIQSDTSNGAVVKGLLEIFKQWGGAPCYLQCVKLTPLNQKAGLRQIRNTDNLRLFINSSSLSLVPVENPDYFFDLLNQLPSSKEYSYEEFQNEMLKLANTYGNFDRFSTHERERLMRYDDTYEVGEFKTSVVGFDSYIEMQGCFYPAREKNIGKKVKVKTTRDRVEIITEDEIIEWKKLDPKKEGKYVIDPGFMPDEENLKWNRQKLLDFAYNVDRTLGKHVEAMLDKAVEPITYYREILKLVSVCNQYNHSYIGLAIQQLKRNGKTVTIRNMQAQINQIEMA